MKLDVIPATSALALASLSAAVLCHWWSVETFAVALRAMPRSVPVAAPSAMPEELVRPVGPVRPVAAAPPPPAQQEFFEALLDEMKQIKRENTTLRDQMAETNRDLMKLEFRVDTHSESFRPLPTTEEEVTLEPPQIDEGPGVLPPRPTMVGIPETE